MYIDTHIHYLPNLVSETKILTGMDKYGIEKSIVLATPDHPRYNQLNLTGNNAEVRSLVDRHPDRLIMAAYVEPRNVMEAQTQIDRHYEKGVRFFKMWPGHGYAPDDPMIYPVWEKLDDLKACVILHMGMLGVRPQLGVKINRMAGMNAKFGQPVLLDQPARMFPNITFVIAHTAYPWSLEAFEMACMFQNIYIDFSCGLGFEGYNLIERLQPGRLAWERFLFATDTAGGEGAGYFVNQWSERMKHPFFQAHTEDFFYRNAENLIKQLGA